MMNTYPIKTAGFLLDYEASAYIVLARMRRDGAIPAEIRELLDSGLFTGKAKAYELPTSLDQELYFASETLNELAGEALAITLSDFEGEVTPIPAGKTLPKAESEFEGELVSYVECRKLPSMFEAAYRDEDELIQEFKDLFDKAGIEFPPEFDFAAHIVNISGTIFA